MNNGKIFWLWEQMVRRGYSAVELARQVRRDPKDIALWCARGCPSSYIPVLTPYLGKKTPEFFDDVEDLPRTWIRIALSHGVLERSWVPVEKTILTIDQARHLDTLGFGVLMHRPMLDQYGERLFALEFHLLPGAVNYRTVP